MKFEELSNEELVFVSVLIQDMLTSYEKAIKKKGIGYIVDSPLGKVHLFKEFSKEELDILSNSDKVRIFRSITDKLNPIVDLIIDNDPGLLTDVEDILELDITEDEDQEEDL